jgi:ATP-dependent helicase Lhr and Lhr-like helicase
VRGEFRPDGIEREWCDDDVLRQLRRRSLAALRKEVEPVDATALARFLPEWQGVGAPRRGLDALVEAIGSLQGAALPASTLEADVLSARVAGYQPADLDALCTSGDVVWIGAGPLGPTDGRVRLLFREQAALLVPPGQTLATAQRATGRAGEPGASPGDADTEPAPGGAVADGEASAGAAGDPLAGPLHQVVRDQLSRHGASFWSDLVAAAGQADEQADEAALLDALWDLVWAGEVTNDAMAPLRAMASPRAGRRSGGASRRATARPQRLRPQLGPLSSGLGGGRVGRDRNLARPGPPAAAGRWSMVAPLLVPAPSPTEAAHAQALQLLERHGVLTREATLAEGVEGGFAAVYPVLKVLEDRGQVRRGYFVAGLGAAQFALPGAVDRLRAARDLDHELGATDPAPMVLAATDPAQPYGAALAWPESPGRPARSAGAFVVSVNGQAMAVLERGGKSLSTFVGVGDHPQWAEGLVRLVKDGRLRKIEISRIDGSPASESPAAEHLRAAGFTDGYKGLTFRL